METFKINKKLQVVCERKRTRTAFKHEATLLENGREIATAKICYHNRTWERFEFDSVIKKLADETGEKKLLKFIKDRTSDSGTEHFKRVAKIAEIGKVFYEGNQKAENDWKIKILKAGLENKGLIIPNDWDELSEDEKEKRLNGVMKALKE